MNQLGTATGLVTKSKQFFIYLGRIAIETNNNQVAEYLKNTFPNVKINNLTEINSEKENRSFKSFKFSVDYLDKSIIDNKNAWPRGSIVSKYRLSYSMTSNSSENRRK